jgi:hypothetical protein
LPPNDEAAATIESSSSKGIPMYGYFKCSRSGAMGYGFHYGTGRYGGYCGSRYSTRHYGCPM